MDFVEQAFFKIGNDSYFLDFLIPEIGIAFEIDGSVHKGKSNHDKDRDKKFESIGIHTIRLSNRDVYLPNIKEIINKKVREITSGININREYYGMNDTNKFEDKLTDIQKALFLAYNELKGIKPKSKVLIKTDFPALIPILNHLSLEEIRMNKDRFFIEKVYEAVSENRIHYDVIYTGDMNKIRGKLKQTVKALRLSPYVKSNDYVIIINKKNISKYNDLRYSKLIK